MRLIYGILLVVVLRWLIQFLQPMLGIKQKMR